VLAYFYKKKLIGTILILVHLWEKTNQLTFQDRLLRFSDFQFSIYIYIVFCRICLENMLVRYWGINDKGVLERPGTIWKVLRAISSTLKFQFTVKCWKMDFLVPCKTKSCQSSTEYLRMVRAVTLDTPRPPQFQPELLKNQFLWKTRFSLFVPFVFCTSSRNAESTVKYAGPYSRDAECAVKYTGPQSRDAESTVKYTGP